MGRVALIGENSIKYIEKLLDIWNGGDCAVLLDWRIPFETAVKMMREADVARCYVERRLLEKISTDNNIIDGDIELIGYENGFAAAQELPEKLYSAFIPDYGRSEAVVLYSSGTTGKAKGIVLSHFALQTNADAILAYMQPKPDDCIYIAKTLSHSSTLTGELLVALKSRTRLVAGPAVVPPRIIFDNIKKYRVSVICLNPALLSICALEQLKKQHDVSSLRTIYVSGSVLNDKIYALAHEVFNGTEIYNVYGLSEAGPRVTAQRADCCKSNSVGKPVNGVELVLVDECGTPVPRGERGIIHVKTPSIYSGYISGTEKFKPLYRNWLNTGDVGFIDENDELHVLDRIDDVIILDSHKIYPSEVQQQILTNTSVIECVVTAVEHKGNTFLGCLYTGYANQNEIVKNLRGVLMPYEIPRFFVQCEDIPKTANGKISAKKSAEVLKSAYEKEMCT